jgi:epoxide hydrolase-like predicted phosphatase
MSDKIKAIIFDIGGVLQLGPKTRFTRKDLHVSGVHEIIANKLKISLDQYFDAIDSHYTKSLEGQISKKKLISILSFNLNYPKKKIENIYFKTYKKKYHKNKKLFKIAKQLKKQGYKIAILSDQWHLSQNALIPKSDQKIFDQIIISCEVGVRKPNISTYELLLNKLKVKPEETIFIDNQSWNLLPANKLKMNTILFMDNKKIKKQLAKFGIKL